MQSARFAGPETQGVEVVAGRRSKLIFIAVYALALLALASLRPLWLDEAIQLQDSYHHSLAETLDLAAHDPGGVPLSYLAENIVVNALGHPLYTARLFPIVCAVFGLAAFLWLAQMLALRAPWPLTASVFVMVPFALRYAVEARPYGPALALSIFATAFVAWEQSWRQSALYALVLAAGLYTQPYVAFIAVAHALWRPNKHVLSGIAAAGLLFLPWYLYARPFWVHAVSAAGYQSTIDLKTPLMIVRELSGGGYLLTLALAGLAIFGYLQSRRPLLALCILVPIPLVLSANAVFHYFFAIRQLLFVVPALCLLAAEGIAAVSSRWRTCLAFALASAALVYDVRWFTHDKYDRNRPAAEAILKNIR